MKEPYEVIGNISPVVIGPGVDLRFWTNELEKARHIAYCLNFAYRFGKYIEDNMDFVVPCKFEWNDDK